MDNVVNEASMSGGWLEAAVELIDRCVLIEKVKSASNDEG